MVPGPVPLSAALGELGEWTMDPCIKVPRDAWAGLTYCNFGLSNAPPDWMDRWQNLRQQLAVSDKSGPAWVAVVYVDWQAARTAADAIIDAAITIDACHGVLFDTWHKSGGARIDLSCKPHVDRVRDSGRFVALAGSVDAAVIRRLAPLAPDLFAVRGSACADGDRLGPIDAGKVMALAQPVEGAPSSTARGKHARNQANCGRIKPAPDAELNSTGTSS